MFAYEKNISLPYKTEKGVPPRATVEGIMPSGLANHNAQGESAIALYMVFCGLMVRRRPLKVEIRVRFSLEPKIRRIQQLIGFDMLEEKHTV